MHAAMPDECRRWRGLETCVIQVLQRYGYREIRLPLLEHTEVFQRSIGTHTDIVSKEMYSFDDRNGDTLTLRPEGTAGCVRACLAHGLLRTAGRRLWYHGPMFRHERPQQGRTRQFHQIGVEVFGFRGPDIDAELLCLGARILAELGLTGVELQLNSLGDARARERYREQLQTYFGDHLHHLDEDQRRRLQHNPLRLLDSKEAALQPLIGSAPVIGDYLEAADRDHFQGLCALLDAKGIAYRVSPRLVRGLDYYTGTVFEWVSDALGAQNTVCAGGRYDHLVERFGGPATPAAGFAMGLERLLSLAGPTIEHAKDVPDACLLLAGEGLEAAALQLAEALREQLPWLWLLSHCGGGSLKSQFKKADRSGAAYALVLGQDELAAGTVNVKSLRGDAPQQPVPRTELATYLTHRLQDTGAADSR